MTIVNTLPGHLALLVEHGLFIGDLQTRHGLLGISNFALRDAHVVADNPDNRGGARDRGVEEGTLLDLDGEGLLGRVVELVERGGEVVDGVALGVEEFAEEGGHLGGAGRVGVGGPVLSCAVLLGVEAVFVVAVCGMAVGGGRVGVGKAGFLVGKGSLHGELVDDGQGEHEAHDSQGTSSHWLVGSGDCKEADETDLRQVDTSEELAQSLLVSLALGVDGGFVDVEEVVPISDVDKCESNTRKSQDKRSNARVCDSNDTKVSPLGELGAP